MQAPSLPDGLPDPDAATVAHSRQAGDFIRSQIDLAGGAITFGEYMHHALYAPGLGYYVSGSRKFGDGGDFITAPEVSPLFGRVIARQCQPLLAGLETANVLEIGAGSGALAAELLGCLEDRQALPDRYFILEVSPELRSRQRAALARRLPHLLERVEWLGALPRDFDGVILANEVADALPVERFRLDERGIEQSFVIAEEGRFTARWQPAPPAMRNAVEALGLNLPVGFEGDICLGLKPWVADLVGALRSGLILLFDYGLSRREYYAVDRSGGWLRCHYQHRAHGEPLVLPGVQDITSWVDFTAVAEAASESGAAVAGYVTQTMFLLHGGVDAEFAELTGRYPEKLHVLAGQLKILTLPTEMGESFKCIGLTKGAVPVVSALAEADRSAAL